MMIIARKNYIKYIAIAIFILVFLFPAHSFAALGVCGSQGQCQAGEVELNNPDTGEFIQCVPQDQCNGGGSGGVIATVWGGLKSFFLDAALGNIVGFFTWLLFLLFGLLLKLAGLLLNESIRLSILQMSALIESVGGIKTAWTVIRDIANIGFIFAILYIGVAEILRITGKGIKQFLAKLILAALLVNFSFFFTGVLIDASNILTISFYKRIAGVQTLVDLQGEPPADSGGGDLGDINVLDPNNFNSISNFGISGIFMQHSKIGTIFSAINDSEFETGTALGIALFGSIFMFILTFAFMAAALMLFIRLIVLIVLLITSPIAYVAWAFPGLKEHSDKWWSTLMGQLLFAPAYMLMTLVVVMIMESNKIANFVGAGQSADVGATISSGFTQSTIGVVSNYLILIGLIMASIIGAKQFASKGASSVGKFVNTASSKAAGSFGFAGRQTVGRGASALLSSKYADKLKTRAAKGGLGGFAARQALFQADRAKKSSFDVRATGTGKALGESLGAGKAVKKRDRASIEKEKSKAAVERAKLLGRSKDDVKEDEEYKRQAGDIEALEARRKQHQEEIEERKREISELETEGQAGLLVEQLKGEVDELGREIKDIDEQKKQSEKELETTLKRLQQAPQLAYARSLSPRAGENEYTLTARVLKGIRIAGVDWNTRRDAAREAIEGDLKKSKDKKLLEEIKNYTKEDKEDKDEDESKAA